MTLVGRHGGRRPDISMQFEMFFQLQTFVKGLPTNFANGRDFSRVLSHVIQKVLFFAENVATDITFMLYFSGVNGDMLFEGIQTGEFPFAD